MSNSIKAIKLARQAFEAIKGNVGLLRFNVENLIPTNGSNGEESKKWDVYCSIYESLTDTEPTKYKVEVDLYKNTLTLNKIDGNKEEEKKFSFEEKK
jgi:hypothetical protein